MTFRRSRAGRRGLAPERAVDPEAVHEAALKLLERARRTRRQLEQKLRERGFARQAIEPVVTRLAEVGLVDDLEYASAFIRERLAARSASWRRLEQELRARGIDSETLKRARAETEQEAGGRESDAEAARRVLAQVARRYQKLDPRVRRQRLSALLARRGFDYSTISQVLAPGKADGDA